MHQKGFVLEPELFVLCFSIMYAFSDLQLEVKFEFYVNAALFNHQRFKAKSLTRSV